MHEQLPVIDWQQHAQTDDGAADMSRELLTLFIEQLPALQNELEEAFAMQNIEVLKAVLHRLQGACAYCGLPRLREVIASANHTLRNTDTINDVDLQIILQEINIVKSELSKHGIA